MGNALWKNFSHSFGWFYINKHNKVRLPRGFYHPPFTLHSKVTHCLCKCRRWLSESRAVSWRLIRPTWQMKNALAKMNQMWPWTATLHLSGKTCNDKDLIITTGFQITFFRFSLDIYPCSYRHNMKNYYIESDFLPATITTVCFFLVDLQLVTQCKYFKELLEKLWNKNEWKKI